jgi:hypothetical protein
MVAKRNLPDAQRAAAERGHAERGLGAERRLDQI